MFSSLGKDVRYACRSLGRNRGFTLTAVLAIALGIGINTGIFSILNSLLLRELAVPNPRELVSVSQEFEGVQRRTVHDARRMFSMSEYRGYRDRTQTLSGIMAYTVSWPATMATLSPGNSFEIHGKLLTCNYFDILQQQPRIGLGFTAANCENQGASPVVVLSHDLWTNTFGSDPEISSRSVVLNGQSFAVVGIAPEGVRDTEIEKPAFFVPVSAQRALRPDRNYFGDDHLSWLMLMGRRKEGVSLEQVRADLARIASQMDLEQPGRRTTVVVEQAEPFYHPVTRSGIWSGSAVVLAAFGLVLLVACANVANLFLARAAGRSKEIAVRLSLGASRPRLIQQLLVESLLVALAGGVLGSVLALWSVQSLLVLVMSSLPAGTPPLALEAAPDLKVLYFALALTVATGTLFGLTSLLQASRYDLNTVLKQDNACSGRLKRRWLRSGLAGVQMAICMVLMIVTALLTRGLHATQSVKPGFDYRNVTVASFGPRASAGDSVKAEAFQRQLIKGIRSLPGIEAVAQVQRTPLSRGNSEAAVHLPGQDQWHDVHFNVVSPGFFSILQIPIVRGRDFIAADLEPVPRTAIVTETTARRFWPDRNPTGETIMTGAPGQEIALTVVGVARDAQLSRIGQTDATYLYLPAGPEAQNPLRLLVRSRADLAALTASIRAGARALDPGMAVEVTRLEENLAIWRNLSRFVTALSAALGALALVLAALGVYGVVSYAVSWRVREFGIRMVLGARRSEVQRMILREMMRPVAIGAVIGLAAAAIVSRILESLLFGISPLDPAAFLGASFFLLAVASAATLVPARRATREDPMTSLRYE